MRFCLGLLILALASVALAPTTRPATTQPSAPVPGKINVAVIWGGHPFDHPRFFNLFEGHDDIAYFPLEQKKGGESFENIDDWKYDVIALYNFAQTITPKQQENFIKLLDRGVGLFIMHHANGAYKNWPEFWKIAGVTYYFDKRMENGKEIGRSWFKPGVTYKVHVADPDHPITRGIKDYEIVDETYCRTVIEPSVHPLLTTTEPSSDSPVGWTKTYLNARVCYIQHGHGPLKDPNKPNAYNNENYRKLVPQAIRWVAKKSD